MGFMMSILLHLINMEVDQSCFRLMLKLEVCVCMCVCVKGVISLEEETFGRGKSSASCLSDVITIA